MASKKRGFTLLELLVVVAIVGTMSALAVNGIRAMLAQGRVSGAANDFTRILTNARVRAIAMACPIGVQINGPTYTPMGAPVGLPTSRSTIIVYRKNVCLRDTTQPFNGWYEAGDHVIASFPYESAGLNFDVKQPTGVISGGSLANDSIVFIWEQVNGVVQRKVFSASNNAATFTDANIGNIEFQFRIGSNTGNPTPEQANIPFQTPPTHSYY